VWGYLDLTIQNALRTFVRIAAKEEKESTAEVSRSCCVRPQHKKWSVCANSYAATQLEDRPLMQPAA